MIFVSYIEKNTENSVGNGMKQQQISGIYTDSGAGIKARLIMVNHAAENQHTDHHKIE
jgi:hypothetical protein